MTTIYEQNNVPDPNVAAMQSAQSNPAFQSGGAETGPIQPGQNLGANTVAVVQPGQNITPPSPTKVQVQPGNTNASTPQTSNYVVQKGDTLSQIAQKNNVSLQDLMKSNPNVTDPNKISTGQQLNLSNQSQDPGNKYKTAAENMKGTAPQNQGDAMDALKDKLPSDTSIKDDSQIKLQSINEQLKNDPGFQKLQEDYKNYQDAQSKQKSLTDIYSQMEKDANLPGLKLDQMNLKNIIDGSENDIRNEITKAGGFATESQVQAMTNARNKQNILDYNKLTSQIDSVQKHLDTMIGLSKEDKANALQEYKTQIDYDKMVNDYTQKFTDNAKSAYQKIVDAPGYGYKALYDSAGGDQSVISNIEKTMGLSNGALKFLASQPQLGSYQVVKGGTDAFGNPMADKIFDSKRGVFVDAGTSSGNGGIGNSAGVLGSGGVGAGTSKLSFDQYGLLANTNFSPKSQVDSLAQKYLDQYIKNGTVPTASSLGRNMKPEAVAQVDARARDLFFQATGHALPNPQIIKGYQQIIDSNNKLSNNLKIQEQTVSANVDFSLANMKKNGLNSAAFAPLNGFLDGVQAMFNDPATQQLIAQNTTIQNELGSLLAVKNASGTTVYDKMSSAGIIKNTDTPQAIKAKVTALLTEAANFAGSLNRANADLYKQVDPFLQDVNNPARSQMQVETLLNKNGYNYQDLQSQMYAEANMAQNPGKQPALDSTTGKPVYATQAEINSGKFIAL